MNRYIPQPSDRAKNRKKYKINCDVPEIINSDFLKNARYNEFPELYNNIEYSVFTTEYGNIHIFVEAKKNYGIIDYSPVNVLAVYLEYKNKIYEYKVVGMHLYRLRSDTKHRIKYGVIPECNPDNSSLIVKQLFFERRKNDR